MDSKKGIFAKLTQSWESLGNSRTYIYIAIILVTVSFAFIYASPNQHTSNIPNTSNNENSIPGKTISLQTNRTIVNNPENFDNNNQTLLASVLFMLSIALIISVAVSFYLYRWRKIILANQNLALPEEFVGSITGLNKGVVQLSRAIALHLGDLGKKSSTMEARISDMTETFMTLQDSLDHKDAEIKRLKQGYDKTIFRKYLLRFVRVDQVIEDYKLDKPEFIDELNQIQGILTDALEECEVERFSPALGSDYRKSEGVADSPRVIEPKTDNDITYNIAEVVEVGYRLALTDGFDIILPAKVKIYGKQ